MSKYEIRNCPAYIHRPLSTHDRVCLLGDKVKPNHKELYVYCKDCTDCVMKQIVELCKRDKNFCVNCKSKADNNIDCIECIEGGRAQLAQDILQLLKIEEVK